MGAQDDAAGVYACWEALRLLKQLDYKPKNTFRFVGWTNEENGARGAYYYALYHYNETNNTILAFESDIGIFNPFVLQYPLGSKGNGEAGWKFLSKIFGNYLAGLPLSLDSIEKAGGGVDIAPLMELGVPGMSLSHKKNDQYFWYPHIL